MADLLRPTDLLQMASEAELAEMEKERLLKKKKQQQELDLREAFMTRKVAPEAIERINLAVSVAAKRGEHQIQAVTFPCTLLLGWRPPHQYRRPRVADDTPGVRQECL